MENEGKSIVPLRVAIALKRVMAAADIVGAIAERVPVGRHSCNRGRRCLSAGKWTMPCARLGCPGSILIGAELAAYECDSCDLAMSPFSAYGLSHGITDPIAAVRGLCLRVGPGIDDASLAIVREHFELDAAEAPDLSRWLDPDVGK